MHRAGRHVVAILCRKDEKLKDVESYAIYGMAEHWISKGIEVRWIFGPQSKKIEADLLFMHINLTVIPESYINYAKQYSRVLNGKVTDIRKSTVCNHIVQQADNYAGPVIVKTDLNAAGRPEERARSQFKRRISRWMSTLDNKFSNANANFDINSQDEYRIYPTAQEVPTALFEDKRYVVQKMMAEQEGDTYFVRNYSFLGDRYSCSRLSSKEPIIHLRNTESVESIEVDPRIVEIRHELGFDYGKFDYVLHNGEVVLLDANKTLGVRDRNETDATVLAMRQERANGIFGYFGVAPPANRGT